VRLLVIGATGGTGAQLVNQALDQGCKVTALVRRPGTVTRAHPSLRVVKGDVLDSPSIEQAVRGQDGVLSALGHKRWLGPTHILSEGTRNIVRAMESCGVKRFVCETSLGVGSSWGRLGLLYTLFVVPFILPFYYWDKGRQEAIIKGSALDWTIVQPGVLTDGSARGTYRHGTGIGSWLWSVRISRADTAAFMLAELTERRYVRQVVEVAY
jgi:putative NADH-flavin reductase